MKNSTSAHIISVGSELTEGRIVNTNATFLACQLNTMGIKVSCVTTIADSSNEIIDILSKTYCDVVIVTGGLGPTHDDVTKEALFSFAEKHLKNFVSKDKWQSCLKKYKSNAKQNDYHICENVCLLNNSAGAAPGFYIQKKQQHFFALPGVPSEAQAIFLQEVYPYLAKIKRHLVQNYTFRTIGMRESVIQKKLAPTNWNKFAEMSILPHIGSVDVILKSDNDIDALLTQFRNILKDDLYTEKDISLEEAIAEKLLEQKKTIAIAESCSGGYASHLMTNIPGSSQYFQYGITSYSNESKIDILGVSADTIKEFGAVSEQCAKEMAKGVREMANVSIGIATTGISGPTGETPDKPLGLVYVAYDDGDQSVVQKRIYKRPRILHKQFSANFVLQLLWRCL